LKNLLRLRLNGKIIPGLLIYNVALFSPKGYSTYVILSWNTMKKQVREEEARRP